MILAQSKCFLTIKTNKIAIKCDFIVSLCRRQSKNQQNHSILRYLDIDAVRKSATNEEDDIAKVKHWPQHWLNFKLFAATSLFPFVKKKCLIRQWEAADYQMTASNGQGTPCPYKVIIQRVCCATPSGCAPLKKNESLTQKTRRAPCGVLLL